jgi:hypothetical protein
MTIEQMVIETFRRLPPERQREALDYLDYLAQKGRSAGPRRSLRGIGANLGVDLTAEDFVELRREMWKGFPREDIG